MPRKKLTPEDVKYIVVHCSATTPEHNTTTEDIRRWHKERGWIDIGYHFVIERNGSVHEGAPLNEVGAHVRGYNNNSIGICLTGGVDKRGMAEANYSVAQYRALTELVLDLTKQFDMARVVGHRDLLKQRTKECPSFNVRAYFGLGELE